MIRIWEDELTETDGNVTQKDVAPYASLSMAALWVPGKKKGPNLSGPPRCRPKATTAVVSKVYHNILSSTIS